MTGLKKIFIALLIVALLIAVAAIVVLRRDTPKSDLAVDGPFAEDVASPVDGDGEDSAARIRMPRRDTETPETEVRPPDAPLEQVVTAEEATDADPEFNPERHASALRKLGEAHHGRLAEAHVARNALRAYEESARHSDPERAVLADEIDELRARIEDRQDELRKAIEEDTEWRDLSAAVTAAEENLRQVRSALYERLKDVPPVHDDEADATEATADVEPQAAAADGGADESVLRDVSSLSLPDMRRKEAMEAKAADLRAATAEVRERRNALSARERAVTEALLDGSDAKRAIAEWSAAKEEREARLRAEFEQDPEWQALHGVYQSAVDRRDAVRNEVQRLIRIRMAHERAQVGTAEDPEGTPADAEEKGIGEQQDH